MTPLLWVKKKKGSAVLKKLFLKAEFSTLTMSATSLFCFSKLHLLLLCCCVVVHLLLSLCLFV